MKTFCTYLFVCLGLRDFSANCTLLTFLSTYSSFFPFSSLFFDSIFTDIDFIKSFSTVLLSFFLSSSLLSFFHIQSSHHLLFSFFFLLILLLAFLKVPHFLPSLLIHFIFPFLPFPPQTPLYCAPQEQWFR